MKNTTTTLLIAILAPTLTLAAPSFKVDKVNIGGDGGHDYITAEPGTGRLFVSRTTHVMVVDSKSGKVLHDFADAPRNHGIALAPKEGHGFITNSGDSTVTMFDLKTLAVIKKIPVTVGGLDGIMFDDFKDRIILTNHSNPVGTTVAIDAKSGEIVGTAEMEDNAPEGAASDGKGRLFVNNERKNTVQVIDENTMKAVASWPLAPCRGPTGIALDRKTERLFSGCSGTSVVTDVKSGKVVASLTNGEGVDALGWDPTEKLIYVPNGRDGTVSVFHQDSADHYSQVATVPTMQGMKTLTVDPITHRVYGFAPEYGPAPAGEANGSAPAAPVAQGGPGAGGGPPGQGGPGAGGPPGQGGRGGARGPVIAGWLFTITH
jgi:DNA-binding beta-propeller fold protein YncE